MAIVYVNGEVEGPVPGELVLRAVREVLEAEGHGDGELSVTFVDDRTMAELSRRYLGRPGVTDVIAFALHDPGAPVLGDVYIGYHQALRQAGELGVDPEEELIRLAIHGVLHVLGYEHPEGPDRDASEMMRRQEALVQRVLGRRR